MLGFTVCINPWRQAGRGFVDDTPVTATSSTG